MDSHSAQTVYRDQETHRMVVHCRHSRQVAQLSQRNRAAGWFHFGWVVGDGVGQAILCSKPCQCQTRSSAKADRTACPYCKQCGRAVKTWINNIGTKVPQSESSRERIGQGRIGTFAGEGTGVGAKRNGIWKKTTGQTGAVSYTHLTLPTKRIV